MSTKAKLITLVVLLLLVGGVVLYSTITANNAVAKLKEKANDDFAQAWNSEESVAERQQVLEGN